MEENLPKTEEWSVTTNAPKDVLERLVKILNSKDISTEMGIDIVASITEKGFSIAYFEDAPRINIQSMKVATSKVLMDIMIDKFKREIDEEGE